MNQIDLQGRMAIVTGGARGIGYAIAQRLLQSGASVSLWDRDADALREAAQSLGQFGKVHTTTVQLLERQLFFQSVQAPKMPGTFGS